MLTIKIPGLELFNEEKEEFIETKTTEIIIEHSLLSISKWESKYKKPFLVNTYEKTNDELIDYIKMMTITQKVKDDVYLRLTSENLNDISNYISDSQTATTFSSLNEDGGSNSIITSEIIYYWMISYNIPFECQKWHLNRLLTLIRVCSIKQNPDKHKINKEDLYARYRTINEARKKKYNTKG